MTDQEKLDDYDRIRKENERYRERLRVVWSILQASEGLQQNNKVVKLILEEVFPHPNVK